jgi:hypothetical protein
MSFSLAAYVLMSPIRAAAGGSRFVAQNTEAGGDDKYYAVAVLQPAAIPADVQVIPFDSLGPFDTVEDALAVVDSVPIPEVPASRGEPGA